MKLTEMQLLQAIGQADEKLIERTAPKESGDAAGKPLIRMRRRTFEILAVCAAFCVFIGGGLLIRSLYQNNMQAPFSAASDDKSEARDVLETFLNACKNGDREQIMELSLIETVCSIIDEDPDSAKEWAAAYRDALASVRKYKIGSCEDITAYLKESRQTEQDLCELYAYGLKEKGKYEEAEKLLGDNPMLDYYDRAEKGYAFQAWLSGSPAGDWDLFDQDGCVISVILYDGRWYVQPVEYLTPKMSEAGKEKLAQYRAADPEYRYGDDERRGHRAGGLLQ